MNLKTVLLSGACLVLAACGGGGSSSGGGTAAVDRTAPTVSFPLNTVYVTGGETVAATLNATDNVGVTSGPTVECTNGGSFANNVFTAPETMDIMSSVCTATAGDAAGNTGTATLTVSINPELVSIRGKATFDLVPINTTTNALDYGASQRSPSRGVTVQAVNPSGSVLASTVSNASGNYSFNVLSNTQVRIRVLAQLISTTGAQWEVKVIDNTNASSLYVLQGNLASSGGANSVRNLNAASGWGGTSYTGTRAAGPFAILNPIYTAIQKIAAVDPDVELPSLNFNWSPQNTAATIGTSYYSGGNIFILGGENEDTDEYDDHVIVHEWGHYFEDNMSRSDSIGGQHGGGDRLDLRVAMGEGFGNAVSAIMTDDPFYRDTNGAGQGGGFSINVESNTHSPEGWFNEGSVQSILYDIYDSATDGVDNVDAGFGPIYNTLISNDYKNSPYFTSIFLFADQFKTLNSGMSAGVDALLTAQSINGTGSAGAGETNSGSISSSLPVYKLASVGGGNVQICSSNNAGTANKLGNRAFVEITPTATGTHTISMTRSSGATARDPDFVIYNRGATSTAFQADESNADSESWTGTLTAGTKYIVDAYDYNNVAEAEVVPGDSCYNFSVTN